MLSLSTISLLLTNLEEKATFITALNENGIKPHVLAIANGSAHGNTYDAQGNLVEHVSIDIQRTMAVAKALRDQNLDVRIAQHGITGTPRELIHNHFPHGDIVKGNVATFYQNLVWDLFKVYEPELYSVSGTGRWKPTGSRPRVRLTMRYLASSASLLLNSSLTGYMVWVRIRSRLLMRWHMLRRWCS